MTPRLHLDQALHAGHSFTLPPAQARHVQVLRLQPGDALILFNGTGGEWRASVIGMGRVGVDVRIDAHVAIDRELSRAVTLAVGMPANERMDALVEKATELGAASIQPLLCERSVLRLDGERAEKRRRHWSGVAVAAAEQSGRTRVPRIAPVESLRDWLLALDEVAHADADRDADADAKARSAMSARVGRYLLSPHHDAAAELAAQAQGTAPLLFLSGPEGGLTPDEEALARRHGFVAISLGPRVLRADTAPLAVLAWCGLTQQFDRR